MNRYVKLALWTAFFVALPITITWSQSARKHCIYDYLKYCSSYSINSKEGQDCMKRAGPQLSDKCITALVNDGLITLDEVQDIADDAGLEIIQTSSGLVKRRKIIAFFDPPLPVRNPRRVEMELAQAAIPPLPERNPLRGEIVVAQAPPIEEIPTVTVPPLPEPNPRRDETTVPPLPERKPETITPPPPAPKPSIFKRAADVIKKGYEKDYIRKPDYTPVNKKKRVVSEKRTKVSVKQNRVKRLYKKRKQSIQAQNYRRTRQQHGFESSYTPPTGGYGSNFQFNDRFRIQKNY